MILKIDRYQGFIDKSNNGAINDHQTNECVVQFFNIPEEKIEILFKACLGILNGNNVDEDSCELKDLDDDESQRVVGKKSVSKAKPLYDYRKMKKLK